MVRRVQQLQILKLWNSGFVIVNNTDVSLSVGILKKKKEKMKEKAKSKKKRMWKCRLLLIC